MGYVPLSLGGAYPGLYLFTSPARFVRPVRNILSPEKSQNIELVGPFEQVNIYLVKSFLDKLGLWSVGKPLLSWKYSKSLLISIIHFRYLWK